jgi:hypothetical protein
MRRARCAPAHGLAEQRREAARHAIGRKRALATDRSVRALALDRAPQRRRGTEDFWPGRGTDGARPRRRRSAPAACVGQGACAAAKPLVQAQTMPMTLAQFATSRDSE